MQSYWFDFLSAQASMALWTSTRPQDCWLPAAWWVRFKLKGFCFWSPTVLDGYGFQWAPHYATLNLSYVIYTCMVDLMGPHLKSQLLITFCSHTTPKTNCLLWKNADYFASSDPQHDISKLLVDTTFVWSFCHGTFAQLTIPIICFTWQVIVHVSLSNRI